MNGKEQAEYAAERWLESTARKAGPHGVTADQESMMRLGFETGYLVRASMEDEWPSEDKMRPQSDSPRPVWKRVKDSRHPLVKVATWVGVFAVLWMVSALFTPKDSTDPADGRSGMGLRIDAKTGCHYLITPALLGGSGITPRLDPAGKHICSGQEQ